MMQAWNKGRAHLVSSKINILIKRIDRVYLFNLLYRESPRHHGSHREIRKFALSHREVENICFMQAEQFSQLSYLRGAEKFARSGLL